MKNQSKYLNKLLSVLMLAFILLANTASVSATTEKNVAKSVTSSKTSLEKHKVVNINKSSYEQLMTLKGIGHSKAQAIVSYRETEGKFKSIQELTKVKGIGEKIVKENMARLGI